MADLKIHVTRVHIVLLTLLQNMTSGGGTANLRNCKTQPTSQVMISRQVHHTQMTPKTPNMTSFGFMLRF